MLGQRGRTCGSGVRKPGAGHLPAAFTPGVISLKKKREREREGAAGRLGPAGSGPPQHTAPCRGPSRPRPFSASLYRGLHAFSLMILKKNPFGGNAQVTFRGILNSKSCDTPKLIRFRFLVRFLKSCNSDFTFIPARNEPESREVVRSDPLGWRNYLVGRSSP